MRSKGMLNDQTGSGKFNTVIFKPEVLISEHVDMIGAKF